MMTARSTHQATVDLYTAASRAPQSTLCCVASPPLRLPGLTIPQVMHEMNYGCGSTVRPSDVEASSRILYLGVGAGLELLQFAYLTRRSAAVVGVDVVDEMLERCRTSLASAVEMNEWFHEDFIELRRGDATALPFEDASFDVVAQNCLFNIFESTRFATALRETLRVLRPGGRLILSDPICDVPLPRHLREDPDLRAQCLSGAIPLDRYLDALVDAGFGTLEVRSRRPYRALTPAEHRVENPTLLETVEVVAVKCPVPTDGPCVFTGRTATYIGREESYDDGLGHRLLRNIPLEVCDKTAAALSARAGDTMLFSPSTWHYGGGGCC